MGPFADATFAVDRLVGPFVALLVAVDRLVGLFGRYFCCGSACRAVRPLLVAVDRLVGPFVALLVAVELLLVAIADLMVFDINHTGCNRES